MEPTEPHRPKLEGFDEAVALAVESGKAGDVVKDLSDRVKDLFSPPAPAPERIVQGETCRSAGAESFV